MVDNDRYCIDVFTHISATQAAFVTAEWIDWYNRHRLHSTLGHRPPAEYESMFYAHHLPDQPELVTV